MIWKQEGIGADRALLSEEKIRELVEKLAKAVTAHYEGKELVLLGVLKGAFVFMADLVRRIPLPLSCEFMRVSSYDASGNPGALRLDFDLTQPVTGKHVLVLEDVVDTGRTLSFIRSHLESQGAQSVKFCALIRKEEAPSDPPVDFLGITAPKGYIIGYGMDLGEVPKSPWIQVKP